MRGLLVREFTAKAKAKKEDKPVPQNQQSGLTVTLRGAANLPPLIIVGKGLESFSSTALLRR
jgi:hypothetical protein